MNSYDRFEGKHVTRLTVSGCPLPCINRILQRGLTEFPALEALDVNECAFRGNSFALVTRAIRKHTALARVRVVQTGVLKKYKNWHKGECAGRIRGGGKKGAALPRCKVTSRGYRRKGTAIC